MCLRPGSTSCSPLQRAASWAHQMHVCHTALMVWSMRRDAASFCTLFAGACLSLSSSCGKLTWRCTTAAIN